MTIYQKLFSTNQEAGTATLRGLFEPHVYFTARKGYLLFNDTLVNVKAKTGDSKLSELTASHFVGFLDDSTDAAQAYAVPNAGFRERLRMLGLDTLQKMINKTTALDGQLWALSGNLGDYGLHYFRGLSEIDLSNNSITGGLSLEFANLINLTTIKLSKNTLNVYDRGSLGIGQSILSHIDLSDNSIAGVNDIVLDVLILVETNNLTDGDLLLQGENMGTVDGEGLSAMIELVHGYNWNVDANINIFGVEWDQGEPSTVLTIVTEPVNAVGVQWDQGEPSTILTIITGG